MIPYTFINKLLKKSKADPLCSFSFIVAAKNVTDAFVCRI